MSSWTTKHQLFTKEETTTQKQEGVKSSLFVHFTLQSAKLMRRT